MMAYIMKFLKKNKFVIIFLLSSISYSMNSLAAAKKTILIDDFIIEQEKRGVYVSFNQEFYLTSNIIDGLKNAIPLVFDINFTLSNEVPYWFDDKILVKKSQYKIKYRNLIEKYEIIDINGEKSFYVDLKDALQSLQNIENWYVGSLNKMNNRLEANIKIKLSKKYLPKPMQINIKDDSWDFQSEEITKYIEVSN